MVIEKKFAAAKKKQFLGNKILVGRSQIDENSVNASISDRVASAWNSVKTAFQGRELAFNYA